VIIPEPIGRLISRKLSLVRRRISRKEKRGSREAAGRREHRLRLTGDLEEQTKREGREKEIEGKESRKNYDSSQKRIYHVAERAPERKNTPRTLLG